MGDAQTGQDAVREAIRILKDFYLGKNGAGGANSATVKTSSAWETDTSMRQYGKDASDYGKATPEAYKGQQDAFNSIHELMKVLLDDFSRSVTETQAQEAQEAADFVKYEKDTKASIASKGKKKTLNESDLLKAVNDHKGLLADLKTNMDLVDAAIKELEELKPT